MMKASTRPATLNWQGCHAAAQKFHAKFIEAMLLLRTEKLPEGDGLVYELKLDGYRAVAFKTGGKVHLRSRNDKDFSARYPAIAAALKAMPDENRD